MTPPLDFAAIRKSCPNAFAALIAWFCQGKHFQLGAPTADSPGYATAEWGPYLGAGVGVLEVGDFRDQYTLNVRELYDFFDANGVIVTIESMLNNGVPIFYGKFLIDGVYSVADGKIHPTRADAEAAAFQAGFEKLEEILNQKEG